MARRVYDDNYERDLRDRRSRDTREMQREQDQRERIEQREHRRTDARDTDRMDYIHDGHSDLRTTRDSGSRTMYSYADQNDRDDQPSRGYMDEPRNRHRQPIDLQPERREEPSSRYQEYFLPGEDINREVIQYDICRYLGNDATVRPYNHPDGRQGYLIKAYRAPTTAMITTLKQDSKRFEVEQAQRRRQFGQTGVSFGASATFDDRQRQGRPDAPPSGYAGYGLDTPMDGYEEDRGAVRGYRDQETRIESRMEPPRQPLPVNRHGQIPPVSQGYAPDQSYQAAYQVQAVSSAYYDQAISQPRTVGPNNTPPPTIGRAGPAGYAGGYTATTSAGYSIPASTASASTTRYTTDTNGRMMVNYPPGVPYPTDRHAASRR